MRNALLLMPLGAAFWDRSEADGRAISSSTIPYLDGGWYSRGQKSNKEKVHVDRQ